jgi:alpha-1,6-mannosyltransferase
MRICDLTTLFIDGGQGGVNTYLLEKARYIAKRPELSHTIVVPGARDDKRDFYGSTLYTIKSRSLPGNPAHRVLARFRDVKRILRDESPSLVEVDCAYMLGDVAAKALGGRVPIIGFYHVHLPTFIFRPRFSRLSLLAATAESFGWRYLDYCYRTCDRLVVTSADMEDRLGKAGLQRLERVPLGVNLDLFHGSTPPTSRADGPVELLSVGRLSREKDFASLLSAFKLLPEGYRLSIVGEGPMRDDLVAQAAGDPRIRFLGALPYGDGIAGAYRKADMLVVPSPNETFNLTVLEGLASGLPVVAIEQGGPRNLVTPDVGELATPGDSADLAKKIQILAGRRVDPAACRGLVQEHYSWDRTFDRLLEVYESSLVDLKRGVPA